MAAACATADGEPYKRGDDVLTGSTGPLRMQVAADLEVVAQRTDPTPEQIVGNPPLGQGAEGLGAWLSTSSAPDAHLPLDLEANRERIGIENPGPAVKPQFRGGTAEPAPPPRIERE